MKISVASVIFSVSMACALAACDRNAPPADNLPSTTATAPQPAPADGAPATTPELADDVNFSVDPGVVYSCEGRDRATSMVKWNVTRAGINSVKVLVMGPEDTEKKTLALLGPVGEAATGNWVANGVRFELVNAETGDELANHTVTSLPCE